MSESSEELVSVDWSRSDSPSTVVVTAVAEVTGTDPVEMPPLYEVVDPDALDSLLAREGHSTNGTMTCVTFTYQGCEIAITTSGDVSISDSASMGESHG